MGCLARQELVREMEIVALRVVSCSGTSNGNGVPGCLTVYVRLSGRERLSLGQPDQCGLNSQKIDICLKFGRSYLPIAR